MTQFLQIGYQMKNAETRCRHKISYLLFLDSTFNSGITKWNKNFKIKCTATKQVSYFTWSSQLCKIQRLDALRLLTTKGANSRPASSHLNLTLLILAHMKEKCTHLQEPLQKDSQCSRIQVY